MLRLRSSFVAAVGRCARLASAPLPVSPCGRSFASSSDSNDEHNEAKKRTQDMADYYSQYLQEYYAPASDADAETSLPDEAEPPIPLVRGETGVFDVDELVTLLLEERAEDIVCIAIPEHAAYADFMVICSGFNHRHLESISETVHKLYKQKRGPSDPVLSMAGAKDRHWRALDMGSIVLHIMTKQTRVKYDLEQLWSVGPEFDRLSTEQAASAAVDEDWLTALPPPRVDSKPATENHRRGVKRHV